MLDAAARRRGPAAADEHDRRGVEAGHRVQGREGETDDLAEGLRAREQAEGGADQEDVPAIGLITYIDTSSRRHHGLRIGAPSVTVSRYTTCMMRGGKAKAVTKTARSTTLVRDDAGLVSRLQF